MIRALAAKHATINARVRYRFSDNWSRTYYHACVPHIKQPWRSFSVITSHVWRIERCVVGRRKFWTCSKLLPHIGGRRRKLTFNGYFISHMKRPKRDGRRIQANRQNRMRFPCVLCDALICDRLIRDDYHKYVKIEWKPIFELPGKWPDYQQLRFVNIYQILGYSRITSQG